VLFGEGDSLFVIRTGLPWNEFVAWMQGAAAL